MPLEAGARRPAQSRRGSRLQGKHGVAFMVLQKVCCVRTKGAWPECWHRGQGATSWQPQTSMPVAVPDCDKCLDPRLLGGQDLLLQGHNLQNFILQGRPMRQVSDRQGEEINLLRADLPLARQPSVAAGIHSLTWTSPPWAPWPGPQPGTRLPKPPEEHHGLSSRGSGRLPGHRSAGTAWHSVFSQGSRPPSSLRSSSPAAFLPPECKILQRKGEDEVVLCSG